MKGNLGIGLIFRLNSLLNHTPTYMAQILSVWSSPFSSCLNPPQNTHLHHLVWGTECQGTGWSSGSTGSGWLRSRRGERRQGGGYRGGCRGGYRRGCRGRPRLLTANRRLMERLLWNRLNLYREWMRYTGRGRRRFGQAGRWPGEGVYIYISIYILYLVTKIRCLNH